ncbi:MAG: hypothetical protein HYU66_25505 [Armatimonadetes bacterium]|nr:hypothetical protein [Armatimonadota bacterium]
MSNETPERCRHYREKASHRPLTAEEEAVRQPAHCWCVLTQREFGPDDGLVGRRYCDQAERSCFNRL